MSSAIPPIKVKYLCYTSIAIKKVIVLLQTIPLTIIMGWQAVQAQPITPAADGTGSVVNSDGNRIEIDGGTLSGDGANLFHSFEQFGLDTGQIAEFLSQPQIQNILGRVIGGDPSLINGLIEVSGGNSNLFLLNPAGIVFGEGASLNLPADFTATTATGVGFAGGWFEVFGANDYQNLVGNPNAFVFATEQPGVIINAGNLALPGGSNFSLLGGVVINTGSVTTSGGTVAIEAVPGTSLVRISQAGKLLSLELEPPVNSQGKPLPIQAADLPTLLTGVGGSVETGLEVTNNGEVQLGDSQINIPVDVGTAIISGDINVAGEGGEIDVFGERIGLLEANLDASGVNGGGKVRIGGDYQGAGEVPNAQRVFVDENSEINADATATGDGGTVILWSDLVTEFYGNIGARGGQTSGNGGLVEVSGKESLVYQGNVDLSAANGSFGTLLLDPSSLTIIDALGGSGDQDVNLSPDDQILEGDADTTNNQISWGQIIAQGATANIILEASGDITVADITGVVSGTDNLVALPLSDGSLTINSTQGNISFSDTNDTIQTQGGDITITTQDDGNVIIGNLLTNGGDITVEANLDTLSTGNLNSSASAGGGNITLSLDGVSADTTLSTGAINASADSGDGGSINVSAVDSNNVTVDIAGDVESFSNLGNGGEIIINASGYSGNTTVEIAGDINSASVEGDAGNIDIEAAGGFYASTSTSSIEIAGDIIATSTNGSGGDVEINLASANPSPDTLSAGNIDTSSATSSGGDITFSSAASGDGGVVDTSGGVAFTLAGDTIINAGTGTINVSNTSIAAGGNDLTFTADEIDFDSLNVREISGTGNLTLQPGTPSQDIAINGEDNTSPTSLEITADELNLLVDGFATITIGREDSSGVITIPADVTFSDPVTIRSPQGGGTITAQGDIFGLDNATITLNADGNITTNSIFATPGITITSTNGSIAASGDISTESVDGDSGAIQISANEDISAFDVLSRSRGSNLAPGNGGAINITSTTGDIDVDSIDSSSVSNPGGDAANAGDITVTANAGSITATEILANSIADGSAGNGGNLNFTATGGSINVTGFGEGGANISSSSLSGNNTAGNAGTITFTATGDIDASGITLIDSLGNLSGEINLTSSNGAVSVPDIFAGDELLVDEIDGSPAFTFTTANGADITISAGSGITTADLFSNSVGVGSNVGGDISLSVTGVSGGISTGEVNSRSDGNNAGSVTMQSPGDITTANINASAGSGGTGGEINLSSSAGSVDTSTEEINSSSIAGAGGAIALSAATTLSSGDINASGVTSGGDISLTGEEIDLVGATVVSSGDLLLQPFNPAQNITVGSTDDGNVGVDITTAELSNLTPGFNSITIGRSDGSGTISVVDDVTFFDPLTLQSPNGNINVNGTITGNDNASITIIGAGNTTTLNADIITAGNPIFIDDSVILSTDINLDTTAQGQPGADITITGTTEGTNQATESLNLTAGIGNVSLQDSVGANIALNDFNLTSADTFTSQGINATTVTLTADEIDLNGGNNSLNATEIVLQPFDTTQNLSLGGNDNSSAALDLTATELNSLGEGANSITIGRSDGTGNIDVENLSVSDPLIIEAGLGQIINNGTITGNDNASLTLNAGNSISPGNLVTDNNDITLNGFINLASDASFTAGSATLTFGDIVTANNFNLTLTADEINLTGGFESVTGTGNLQLQPSTASLDIIVAGSDNQTAALDLTTEDLDAIAPGFSNVIIGRDDSSGTITIDSNGLFYNNPLTLQTPQDAGNIQGDGEITSDTADSLTLVANQDIILSQSVITLGGDVEIISNEGRVTVATINTSPDVVEEFFEDVETGEPIFSDEIILTEDAGDITVAAAGDIQATDGEIAFQASVDAEFSGDGGNITLESENGSVDTNSAAIDSSSSNGNGGDITLEVDDNITTGDIESSGNSGGDILLQANTTITTGAIDSSGSFGDGGDVIIDPDGDVQVESINAQGGDEGEGGTVDVTTDSFFRASQTFSDRNGENASISSAGGEGGGDITIRHGGRGITPFIVGDGEVDGSEVNGTAGAITNADFAIPPDSYPFTERRGNVAVISVPPPESREELLEELQQETNDPTEVATRANPQDIAFVPEESQLTLKSLDEAQEILRTIERNTGVKPAVIYVNFVPPVLTQDTTFRQLETNNTLNFQNYLELPDELKQRRFSVSPADTDILELLMVTSEGVPYRVTLPTVTRKEVIRTARRFYNFVSNRRQNYLFGAQQMYRWIIEPLEAELETKEVENLLFIMDEGLRLVPVAAFHDGEEFVAQKYSTGLAPSLSLTDTRYRDIKDQQVLVMGASQFPEEQQQTPLPAVEIEVPIIANQLWSGKSFLNQDFTFSNLKASRQQTPFGIVHLATHADFKPGDISQSYIQLFDRRLRLDEVRELGWSNPPVELLVLSACRSAFGNEDAELGFAGLAVQAGVKSAMASLWYVGDTGTLALMSRFYGDLDEVPIKAEALREAQVALIEGQVRKEDGKIVTPTGTIDLPSEAAAGDEDLSHPYYWGAFTLVGNPW